jgi:hypothetical protein
VTGHHQQGGLCSHWGLCGRQSVVRGHIAERRRSRPLRKIPISSIGLEIRHMEQGPRMAHRSPHRRPSRRFGPTADPDLAVLAPNGGAQSRGLRADGARRSRTPRWAGGIGWRRRAAGLGTAPNFPDRRHWAQAAIKPRFAGPHLREARIDGERGWRNRIYRSWCRGAARI